MNKRLSLNDVEWGEFNFTEIFSDIFIAKSSDSNKLQKGKVPFIGRSSINNGYQGDYDVEKEKVVKGNSITVSMVGEPKAFYQHYDFTCSQNILILQNDESLNRYNATFLCSIIDQYLIKKGYGYGYPVGLKRVIRNSLLLPSDENLKPNWQFMEDYIKQEQKIIAHKVIDYYEQKMLETAFDLVGLEDVEWKNFKLGSLFTFERKPSKGLNHLDTDKNRGISYLGATNKNNGVLEFVDPISNLVYRGNCIAFIRNGEGSMGYSVYKKENFMATQDISVGYNENLNQYNGMFITTVADRVRGKYNFGYKRNQSRLENEILTLPADKNGNPHWEYMSKFMQKLEVEKISNFLPYIYIYIRLLVA
ncbi:restriction endonuclease subunit S [Treponema phagedenis]|uniref:restriction endonuclease subunit S n=2 Tax=Treponema phagedenis TaxID=162 RepID=UPI001C0682F8|nr:restriction endonuclease subunit S [Treponema phagedenis]